jgi:hypothetical protein
MANRVVDATAKTKSFGHFTPQQFAFHKASGVVGDGTDDGPALASMSEAINGVGGGQIDLGDTEYWVGSQVLHSPGVGLDGIRPGLYRFYPATPYPINIKGCTKPVVIYGGAASIRCLPRAKYGNFKVDGTPWDNGPTYSGDGAAAPYFAMVNIEGCSGPITGTLPEMDGNIKNASIGGPWAADGSGRQLPMTGLRLYDNTGPILLQGGRSHHHGLDGLIGNGPGKLEAKEQVVLSNFISLNNGRNNGSIVGANGWHFHFCKFNEAGKDVGMKYSAPGAGLDLESEGGRYVVNITFDRCEFADNTTAGLVADTAAKTYGITCQQCRFVGTTSWAIWPNRPYMRFLDCQIVGAITSAHASADPDKATKFVRCQLTDDISLSPTGQTYGGGSGYIHFDTGRGTRNILFDECCWTKTKSGGDSVNGAAVSSLDGPGLHLRNNTIERLVGVKGHLYVYGIYSGERTKLVNVIGIPSFQAKRFGLVDVGPSIDSFYYDGSAVFKIGPARFSPSFDKTTGQKAKFRPPRTPRHRSIK